MKGIRGSGGILRQLLGWAGFCAIIGVFCEVGSRVDDWFFDGISPMDNPSLESLFVRDENGLRRGQPNRRWKKVVMNNIGMRGAYVSLTPRPGCSRWMFLGASETFGDPAVANAEYPAQLRELPRAGACIEILNAAFPGIAPSSLLQYYAMLAKHAPDVVFIYPSTHFYLAGDVPAREKIQSPARTPPPVKPAGKGSHNWSVSALLERSRFYERLRDTAETPAFIQKKRLQGWIEDATRGKPADWLFPGVPQDRLDLLSDDLLELIRRIRDSGAEPVLMTHAVRVANPPRAEDLGDLYSMRVYVPRAEERVIAEFVYAAAERARQLAAQNQVRLVDVARLMNGRRELFVDLVHFTSAGHEEVAELINKEMAGGSCTAPPAAPQAPCVAKSSR